VLSEDIKELIYKLALKNAVDYGKAKEGPVINKILSGNEELRKDMSELSATVREIVSKVNSMSASELAEAFAPYKAEFEKKETEKKESSAGPHMELEGATVGNFASRFPPEPNGYIHIGNTKQAFLSQTFAEIYHGKFFLYFDDTNPEKDRQEYVDAIKEDTAWLGLKFDAEYYASDSIEKIYEYAKDLLKKGKAYVCFCTAKEINENRRAKRACEHRDENPEAALSYFEDMLGGKYHEGEAVVRFKGDMNSENTVMRDPVLLRIKTTPHYRQGSKYIVWPTYFFNTPINDSIHGVTDAIRSKEYELSDELYVAILSSLGLRVPRVHDMARLRIQGTSTHKRELKELISKGIVSGYDDPRLVTIRALRKRGILPEAIKRFVLRFGMSKTDSIVSIEMLLAENRKLIDGRAKRLFFVSQPIKLVIKGMGQKGIKLRLHPTEDLGFRYYTVGDTFFISASDAASLRVGDVLCLKDLACVKVINIATDKIETSSITLSMEELSKATKVQWVSDKNFEKCKIEKIGSLFLDGKLNEKSIEFEEGLVESYVNQLNEGDVVNFERVGFFKYDSKKDRLFLSL